MNKSELIDVAAEKAELTKIQTAKALNAILEAIEESVAKRDDVVLVGFGTFKAVFRPERMTRNPQTGEPIKSPAKWVPKFAPGATFKTDVASANAASADKNKKKK